MPPNPNVHGQGGRKLSDHWSDGMKTLHGFSTHGFPNCFQMGLGGKVSERGGLNSETYTPGVNAFNAVLAEWRATGELPGLELG